MTTTTEARELMLYVVNDGKGYARRCEVARLALGDHRNTAAASLALAWVEIARRGAFDYDREFGDNGRVCGRVFSAADILGAAFELAEYYEQHIKEMA